MLNYIKRSLLLISIMSLTSLTVVAMENQDLEPNRTYALKSISGKGWLDGVAKHGDNPTVADNKRIPMGDKYLQWVIAKLENGNYVLKSVSSNSYLNGRTKENEPVLVSDINMLKKDKMVSDIDELKKHKALQWKITKLISGNYALESVQQNKSYLNGKRSIEGWSNNGLRTFTGDKVSLTKENPEGNEYLQWKIKKLK